MSALRNLRAEGYLCVVEGIAAQLGITPDQLLVRHGRKAPTGDSRLARTGLVSVIRYLRRLHLSWQRIARLLEYHESTVREIVGAKMPIWRRTHPRVAA